MYGNDQCPECPECPIMSGMSGLELDMRTHGTVRKVTGHVQKMSGHVRKMSGTAVRSCPKRCPECPVMSGDVRKSVRNVRSRSRLRAQHSHSHQKGWSHLGKLLAHLLGDGSHPRRR